MSQDPVSLFSRLLQSCIRDEYVQERRGSMLENFICVLLGLGSSILTTYLLSSAGLFV